jgi:hypothetical protein
MSTHDTAIAPGTYYWASRHGREFVAHRAEVRADGRALSVGTLWAPAWAPFMAEHNRLHSTPEQAIEWERQCGEARR